MISICDDFGFKKLIASNEGTSTPSDRHLALDTTRHSLASVCESRNHCSAPALAVAFWVPSTCLVLQPNCSGMPAANVKSLNLPAKSAESLIRLVYTIAVWSGRTSFSGSGFSNTLYSPIMRAKSVRLMSPASVVASVSFCNGLTPHSSLTPKTMTL